MRSKNAGSRMNLNQPLVSIGIPVYNGEGQIENAVRSVMNQTYTNLQVIISDNASSDRTGSICERLSAEDPRVHYSKQPVNLGPSANFATVLDLARGEYFMWLGHDDWLSEGYIEACVGMLSEDPDVSLACGQVVYYQEGVEVFRGDVVQLPQESPQKRVTAFYRVVWDNGTFYGLMRRDQLVKVKMNNVMGGDWLLIASMAFLGNVVTLPGVSVHRERGGTSRSYENIADLLGLPKFHAVFPHVAIAYFAFRDIVWSDPLYSLGVFQRVHLGWKCQRSIRLRHGASLWDVFRKILSLCKQYGKSVIVRDDEEPKNPGDR